jgi:ankyrin repeat protein
VSLMTPERARDQLTRMGLSYDTETLMPPERARDELTRMGLPYDTETFKQTAREGDAAAVTLFLRAGMKPDEKTPGTPSALEFALDEGHPAVAKILIQAGANVNRSLLSVAQSGNEDLFHLLLSKKPDQEGLAGALYLAAENGHIKLVKQILDIGLSANDKWGGKVPLNGAAYGGRTDVVKLLLNRGANANAVDTGSGGTGETALHSATRSEANTLNIVGLLLGAGASVNVQDKSGKTPLMNALDHRDIVFLLLQSSANLNLRDDVGATALMYAAARHLAGMIKVLVDKGGDINAQNNRGWTPLMYTSGAIDSVDDPETVQAVLDNGADVNKPDVNAWTALMYAAQKGLNGAARVMIGAGADRDKRNKDGQTALQLATIDAHKQIISMLCSHSR